MSEYWKPLADRIKARNETLRYELEYEKQRELNLGKEPKERVDDVNHPAHYTKHKWEVIEVLEEFFPTDPLLFNVGKYILRHEHKENAIQDLKKAAWYLARKIKQMEADDGFDS